MRNNILQLQLTHQHILSSETISNATSRFLLKSASLMMLETCNIFIWIAPTLLNEVELTAEFN